MATISSYDSSSLGVLFSSFKNNSNVTGGFGTSDLLGINYSDYASIKTGGYYKLLKSYYESDVEKPAFSTSTSKDSAKKLAKIEDSAEKLKKDTEALLETGSKSVFKKVTKKNEDGTTSTEYDKDAIYKAVKNFVEDYNGLVDELDDANTTNLIRTAKSMLTYVNSNSNSLGKLGITIGTDYRLSIEEEAFKKADMETVKSMFHSTGAFGYQISARASMIHYYAENEASKSNTYKENGMYTFNYNTGTIYNSEM